MKKIILKMDPKNIFRQKSVTYDLAYIFSWNNSFLACNKRQTGKNFWHDFPTKYKEKNHLENEFRN